MMEKHMRVTTEFPYLKRSCLGSMVLAIAVGSLEIPGQLMSQTIAELTGASDWVPSSDEKVPVASAPDEFVTLRRC
jgi:hypothetical protein